MRLIDGADRIAGLDEKRGRAFTKRTEVGRDLTKAEGELARLPALDPGTAIDVAALHDEARKLADMQRAGDGLGLVLRDAEREAATANDKLGMLHLQIAEIEQRLEKLRAQVPELERARAAALERPPPRRRSSTRLGSSGPSSCPAATRSTRTSSAPASTTAR
jgi:chromosome segregation ATPase